MERVFSADDATYGLANFGHSFNFCNRHRHPVEAVGSVCLFRQNRQLWILFRMRRYCKRHGSIAAGGSRNRRCSVANQGKFWGNS